jgi:PAS domain S-box-containing protein
MNRYVVLKAVVGVILALALLVAGIYSFEQLKRQAVARQWLMHTVQVINQITAVRANLKDAELAEQSYLLTDKEEYLKIFAERRADAQRLVEVVRNLTRDNPEHQRLLGMLSVRVDDMLAALKENIDLQRQGKHEEAFSPQRNARNVQLLQDVRSVISEMTATENRLLSAREETLNRQAGQTTYLVSGLIGLAILFALMMVMAAEYLDLARQKSLKQIEEKERNLSDFFENAVVAMHWKDADGQILKVNKAECAMLGYTEEELVGHNIAELHVEPGKSADILARLKAHQELRNYEARVRCKDGSIKDVIIDSNVHFEHGKFVHTRSFMRDVTLQKKAEAELSERDIQTQALVETASDAVLTFNSQGTIRSSNKAAGLLFGWPPEDMCGLSIRQFLPEFDALDEVSPADEPGTGVYQVKRTRESIGLTKDGRRVPIELSWSVLQLKNRSIFSVIIRDISERKAVENGLALQNAIVKVVAGAETIEAMTRRILETAGRFMNYAFGSVWLVDKAENTLKCMDLWCLPTIAASHFVSMTRSFTFAPGIGLPGRVWSSGTPSWVPDVTEDRNFPRAPAASEIGLKTACAFPIYSEGEVLGVFEFIKQEKSGQPDESMFKCFEAVGSEIGHMISRQRTLEKITLSENKFRAIFDQTFGFIGLLTPEGNVLDCNRTALEFAGIVITEVVGKPFWETPWWTHSVELQEKVKAAIKKAATGEFVRFETVQRSWDGQVATVDFSIKPVFDPKGAEVVFLIPEGRDISEKKEAEKRISEFYSMVSHELRTPLTSIRGSLRLIEGGKTGPVQPQAMRLVTVARAACDRLVRIVNDILDLKKIEAGKMELNKTKLEPGDLAVKVVEALNAMAAEAGVTLESTVTTNRQIFADSERIMQVITNLVSNAIKFSPQGGRVTVRVESRGDDLVRFGIADQGPGILPEQMHKLFQVFQQLDSSDARRRGGTGLGLVISKSIVEQHGGHIGVDSEVGKGSVFWFDLPAESSGIKGGSQGGISVLIIEPSDYWVDQLNLVFNDTCFDPVYVTNIAAANEQIEHNRPDVLVLDLQTTDGDGIEFLEKLKHDQERSAIPKIVLSSNEQGNETQGQAFLMDWIVKPFESHQIKRAVLNVLRPHKKGQPVKVLIVDDDSSTREILREQIHELHVECLEACDGLQAIDMVRKEDIDLLILDVGLPLLDGFEVVKVLRGEGKNKYLPLLVYTHRDLSKEDRKNLSLGLTTYLEKSRTASEDLLKCLQDLLNGLIESVNEKDKAGVSPQSA